MVIETLLGALIGGLTSIIPGIISFLQRKDELNHAYKMAEIEAQLASQRAKFEMDVVNAKADASEGDSLRAHDSSLDGTGFISALRRSVRPVITYIFFGLFVFIKVIALLVAIQSLSSDDWLMDALVWSDLLPVIWDAQTSAIFAAIMGFWFGGRQIEKMLRVR